MVRRQFGRRRSRRHVGGGLGGAGCLGGGAALNGAAAAIVLAVRLAVVRFWLRWLRRADGFGLQREKKQNNYGSFDDGRKVLTNSISKNL